MATKQNETEFSKFAGHYNIWAHKWGDIRQCPNCHTNIYTARIHPEDKRERDHQESIVDYLAFIGYLPVWVECKGSPGKGVYRFKDEWDIRQHNFMQSWTNRGVYALVFLTFGEGRAPDGRAAFLMPYTAHFHLEDTMQTSHNRVSLPFDEACEYLQEYRLQWIQGGWKIDTDAERIPWIAQEFPDITRLPKLF